MADSLVPKNNSAAPAANIPISLGKPSLRRRLEDYYSLVCPESIQDTVKWRATFPQIYEKYGGTYEGERKLASKLAKKYGSTVRLLLAESVADHRRNAAKTSAAAASESKRSNRPRDELWFKLRPEEAESGVIDFTSPRFDPMAVLQEKEEDRIVRENPWVPHCPVLSFVDQFRTMLPTNDPLFREPRNNNSKPSSADSKKSAAQQLKPRNLGPFASIAEHHQKGPVSLLHRLFESRQRIRILVRYVNCIRGTLTGYIMAYDKHLNMILRDVDEVYCPRETSGIDPPVGSSSRLDEDQGTGESKEIPSNLEVELGRRIKALRQTTDSSNHNHSISTSDSPSSTRWQVRQRHMKQMLVRGDNVVMVYKAESERSAWPHTAKSPAKSVHGRKGTVVPPDRRVGTPGSLIYSLQQQQQRRRSSHDQRYDYRSSPKIITKSFKMDV